jgi:hypothetical protein
VVGVVGVVDVAIVGVRRFDGEWQVMNCRI